MSNSGSITAWIQRLQEGDRAAVERIWEGYYSRLVALARKKLQGLPRHMADEEDVALSALKSFCRAAQQKKFPKLADSGDLWQILVTFTRNKAGHLRDYHSRAKRDFRRVQKHVQIPAGQATQEDSFFLNLIQSGEPDPLFAAEMAEQFEHLLGALPDDQLRAIALRKMEGYTNDEIASQLQCARVTVERRLDRIRKSWRQYLDRKGS